MLVVGDKEVEDTTFAVRKRGVGEIGNISAGEMLSTILSESANHTIF